MEGDSRRHKKKKRKRLRDELQQSAATGPLPDVAGGISHQLPEEPASQPAAEAAASLASPDGSVQAEGPSAASQPAGGAVLAEHGKSKKRNHKRHRAEQQQVASQNHGLHQVPVPKQQSGGKKVKKHKSKAGGG